MDVEAKRYRFGVKIRQRVTSNKSLRTIHIFYFYIYTFVRSTKQKTQIVDVAIDINPVRHFSPRQGVVLKLNPNIFHFSLYQFLNSFPSLLHHPYYTVHLLPVHRQTTLLPSSLFASSRSAVPFNLHHPSFPKMRSCTTQRNALFPSLLLLLLLLLLESCDAAASAGRGCRAKSVCVLSSSLPDDFHLTALLKDALENRCSPCFHIVPKIQLCDSEDATVFFSPPHSPDRNFINGILADGKIIGTISFSMNRKILPKVKQGTLIFYGVQRRIDAKRTIPIFARSICDALYPPKASTPSPTPSSSPTPMLRDFNRVLRPNFNLRTLEELFQTLVGRQINSDVVTDGALLVNISPSPSPYLKPTKHPKGRDDPWAVWRTKLVSVASRQQVVQVCSRANCAARVVITSQQFIRRNIINNALNVIRARPSFASVFNRNRSLYTIQRQGNRKFIVIIPFRQQYLAEF